MRTSEKSEGKYIIPKRSPEHPVCTMSETSRHCQWVQFDGVVPGDRITTILMGFLRNSGLGYPHRYVVHGI